MLTKKITLFIVLIGFAQWTMASVSSSPPPYTPKTPPPSDCPGGGPSAGGPSGGGSGSGPNGGGSGGSDGPESVVGDPIGVYTGRFLYTHTDLTVNGVFPISMVRRYDNQKRYDSPLGYGWAFTYDRRLYTYENGFAILRQHCGQRLKYTLTGDTYTSPDGVFSLLTKNSDNSHTLSYQSGRKEHYDAQGRLAYIQDPQGNKLEMQYASGGKLPLIGASPYSITPDKPDVVARDYRLIKIRERLASGGLSGKFVDIKHNADGRITQIIAHDGRTVSYEHDRTQSGKNGNLLKVKGLQGKNATFEYDDPNDAHNVTLFKHDDKATAYINTYNPFDQVTQQTHGNDILSLSYTGSSTTVRQTVRVINATTGRLEVIKTANSQYFFNDLGYTTKVIDALGNETRTTYNAQYRPIVVEIWQKPAAGGALALYQSTQNTFDANGNKLTESVQLMDGSNQTITTRWEYEQGSWVKYKETFSSAKPDEKFRTRYTFYYRNGVPSNIKTIERLHANGAAHTTSFIYDDKGRVKETTLPDGTKMITEYNGAFVSKTYYKVNGQTINNLKQDFGYDNRGNRNRVWDARGNLSRMEYDDRGRVIKQTNALGQEDRYIYENDNLVRVERGRTSSNGEGQVTRMTYDRHNNLTKVEAKLSGTTWITQLDNTYDSHGNQLTSTDGEGRTTTTTYDALHRVSSVTDAKGNTTSYQYDAVGNQTQITDALGRITDFQYDGLNRLIRTRQQAVDPWAVTRYTYDAVGNLKSVTDPEGSQTTYSYDRLSRRIRVIQPKGQQVNYQFDNRDRITQQKNSRGQIIDYTYYEWGPLKQEDHAQTNVQDARQIKYRYDSTGNLKAIGDNQIKQGDMVTFEYDKLNRETQKEVQFIPGGNKTIGTTYDRYGNINGMTLNDGNNARSTYVYDKLNRVRNVTLPANKSYTLKYYDNNDLEEVIYPSGIVRSLEYETNGPIKRIRLADQGGSEVEDLHYTYDNVLNINSIQENTGTRSYQYDGLDHLTNANYPNSSALNDEHYEYDHVGNREKPNNASYYQHDENHRLTKVNGQTYSYDVDGNLENRNDGSNLSYDPLNRLVKFTKGTTTANYYYNPQNQRIKKKVNNTTTFYLYAGANLIAEYNGAGQRTKRYDYLPGKYVATQVTDNNGTYEVHDDHLDTPRFLTNQNKQVVWKSEHDAFGQTTPMQDPDGNGKGITFNQRFPGQYFDQETGLYYNWNRYYDPTLGRYITSDPIGLEGGINTYNYTASNPITKFDSDGKRIKALGALAGYAGFICRNNRKLCREAYKCISRPKSCKKRFCKLKPNQLYHPFCDQRGCKPCDSPATKSFLLTNATICLAMRQFVTQVCHDGKSDAPHEKEEGVAREKIKSCS